MLYLKEIYQDNFIHLMLKQNIIYFILISKQNFTP